MMERDFSSKCSRLVTRTARVSLKKEAKNIKMLNIETKLP